MELYFNDSMQTVHACGGGGDGSQQREVADGADVVFTDTRISQFISYHDFAFKTITLLSNSWQTKTYKTNNTMLYTLVWE